MAYILEHCCDHFSLYSEETDETKRNMSWESFFLSVWRTESSVGESIMVEKVISADSNTLRRGLHLGFARLWDSDLSFTPSFHPFIQLVNSFRIMHVMLIVGLWLIHQLYKRLFEPTHEPCALRSYIVPQSLPAFGGQLRMQVGRDRNMGSSLFPSDWPNSPHQINQLI